MLRREMQWQRYDAILSHMAMLKVATREQIATLVDMGGQRNQLRILKEMECKGLLKSHRDEVKYFWLSKKGADRIGVQHNDYRFRDFKHHIMRNELWFYMQCPDWQIEVPVKIRGRELLRCDAMYKQEDKIYFVEVDRTNNMKDNVKKMESYRELFQHEKRGRVVFYTTPNRRHQLEQLVGTDGVALCEDSFG